MLHFSPGGGAISEGIFATPGGLHTIADINSPVPAGTGVFRFFDSPVSIDGTEVAFSASGFDGQEGVFIGNGALSVVSNQVTAIPGGSGNFIGHSNVRFHSGQTAFRGLGASSQRGIYQTTPGLARVADRNTQVPGWPSSLTFVEFPALAMDDEQVAFTATANINGSFPGVGVYSNRGGTLHAVADRNTPVPGGGGLMREFSFFLSADEGNVAFAHSSTNLEESISGNFDDVLQVLVNQSDVIPGAESDPSDKHFFQFGQVALSGENIVFFGNNVELSHLGFYALFENELLKVIEYGDTLDGRIVDTLGMTAESFDGNQFAFRANFTDGSSGIYLATIPEPASGFLLLLASTAVATRRRS